LYRKVSTLRAFEDENPHIARRAGRGRRNVSIGNDAAADDRRLKNQSNFLKVLVV
jgi:hypothetical protein